MLRRLIMAYRLPPPTDSGAVKALCRANGDLARLGNLLKLMLDQRSGSEDQWHQLHKDLLSARSELRERILQLNG